MITEKELKKVGHEPYLGLLGAIKAFKISGGMKNSILIPESEVRNIAKLKLEETIDLLIKYGVLEKFVEKTDAIKNGIPYEKQNLVTHSYQENYFGHIRSHPPRQSNVPESAYYDIQLECRMSVEDLDRHIAEIHKLGNKAPTTKIPENEELTASIPPRFNAEISRLSFRGKDIQISKKEYSNPNKLLRALLLLGTPHRRWNYDEIWGEGKFGEGDYAPKRDMQSIYQAAKDVNEKVFKATQVEKFLDFNTTSVMVNPVNIP